MGGTAPRERRRGSEAAPAFSPEALRVRHRTRGRGAGGTRPSWETRRGVRPSLRAPAGDSCSRAHAGTARGAGVRSARTPPSAHGLGASAGLALCCAGDSEVKGTGRRCKDSTGQEPCETHPPPRPRVHQTPAAPRALSKQLLSGWTKGDTRYDETCSRLLVRTEGWPARERGTPRGAGGGARQAELGAGPREEPIPIHFRRSRICKEAVLSKSRQARQRGRRARTRARLPVPVERRAGWAARGRRRGFTRGLGNRPSSVTPSTTRPDSYVRQATARSHGEGHRAGRQAGTAP